MDIFIPQWIQLDQSTFVSWYAVFSAVAWGMGPEVTVSTLIGFTVTMRVVDTDVFPHKVQILHNETCL